MTCVLAALGLAAQVAVAQDIVRCKDVRGAVTYQPAPCPDRTEESRPGIPSAYPAPNAAESQRIFDREAALDRRLEARRDREVVEQQMREARAERESAERERLALLAAQQQQYAVVYPLWARRAAYPAPRHAGQPILR
jgi:hypothetical protein